MDRRNDFQGDSSKDEKRTDGDGHTAREQTPYEDDLWEDEYDDVWEPDDWVIWDSIAEGSREPIEEDGDYEFGEDEPGTGGPDVPDAPDGQEADDPEDEEIRRLVLAAQREALQQEYRERSVPKKPSFGTKAMIWMISVAMVVSTFAFVLELYPIAAVDFLRTSSRLSEQDTVQVQKKSVVSVVTPDGSGTGFIISDGGTILTNHHVVEGYDRVSVVLSDDRRFMADVTESYPDMDMAVLETGEKGLPSLKLAESLDLMEGDPVTFIGNPLSFRGVANEGTVIGPITLAGMDRPVIMMKAPVYRGNSGSPVLDRDGLVVGIIFATLEHESEGKVGLFVPISELYRLQGTE
ncbi:V8-like Glu-specific endopeptidase [Bhargavaea ullalensis]|uniref:V8-like Glu-specific endopeptidase n=1 Tax=Bhargavaea ullalensis TaxID=1265685 RepID=A0ABV2GDR2_9BACL